jgi:hypothetical protein
MDLPIEMPVSIRLPSGAGVRMVEAAEREFASQSSVRPVGGFRVRWEYPSTAQATIERLGWDLTGGSSELEVRQVIDLLAGWPVATPSVRQRAGAA